MLPDGDRDGAAGFRVAPSSAAIDWYRQSAERGWAQAQVNLGAMYAEGRGVARDLANHLVGAALAFQDAKVDVGADLPFCENLRIVRYVPRRALGGSTA